MNPDPTEWRETSIPYATEPVTEAVQQARRRNFIKTNRLSQIETVEIPAGFDPGPEFD